MRQEDMGASSGEDRAGGRCDPSPPVSAKGAHPSRGFAFSFCQRRCRDCLPIGGRPWCVMNCSGVPNNRKARI